MRTWFHVFLLSTTLFVSSRVYAYALPPKVLDLDGAALVRGSEVKRLQATRVEVMSREPVLHGGLWVENGRINVLSPDASVRREWPVSAKSFEGRPLREAASGASTLEDKWKRRRVAGDFELSENRESLLYRPERRSQPGALWEVPLGFRALALSLSPSGWLLGWGAYPARLFIYGPDRLRFNRFNWSTESEPVSFATCEARRSLLVENMRDGNVRFFFFEGDAPRSYATFDFAAERDGPSDVTAVASLNCREHIVGGSFGIARVVFE